MRSASPRRGRFSLGLPEKAEVHIMLATDIIASVDSKRRRNLWLI